MKFRKKTSFVKIAQPASTPLPTAVITPSGYGGPAASIGAPPTAGQVVATPPATSATSSPAGSTPASGASPGATSGAGTGTSATVSSQSAVKTVAQQIMETAARMGVQAQELNKELEERDVLISQLLTNYGGDEDEVVKIITHGLFQTNLSWQEFFDLCQLAIEYAVSTGENIRDIMDFSLAHIDKIQNIQLTRTILEEAKRLKAMFRNVPVLKILADDFKPSGDPEIEAYKNNALFWGDDPANFLLFQQLRGMVTQRKSEQMELVRREFQQKLRQKAKAVEKANRNRATVDMMESIEYLTAETASVNYIMQLFKDSIQNPNIRMFRRVLRDLRSAQVLKDEFLGGMQFKSTKIDPREFENMSSRVVVPKVRSSSSENNIVTAQKTPNPPGNLSTPLAKPAAITNPRAMTSDAADAIFEKNKPKANSWINNQIIDLNKFVQATKNYPQFSSTNQTITSVIRALQKIRAELKGMKSKEFMDKFIPQIDQVAVNLKMLSDNLNSQKKAKASSKSFVKIAAITPAAYNPSMDPWIEGGLVVLAGASFIGALANGDLAGAAGIAAGAYLLYQQNAHLKASTITGRALPKNTLTAQEVLQSKEAFKAMGASNAEAQTLTTLQQYRNNVKDVIQNLESSIMSRIQGEVARGKNSSSVASAPPEEAAKDFKEFMNLLQNVIRIIRYENTLVDQMRQRAQNAIPSGGKINPTLTTSNLLKYKASLQKDLRDFEDKRRKYASFKEVVANYIRMERIMSFIRTQVPFLQNIIDASGTSVADMVLNGGILQVVENAANIEKQNVDKLNSKILSIDPMAYEKFLGPGFKDVRSPSLFMDNRTRTAANELGSIRFSNLIVEAQTALTLPTSTTPPVLVPGATTVPTTPPPGNPPSVDPVKVNETLANIIANTPPFTFEQLKSSIPYALLQNDQQKLEEIKFKINRIPDIALRQAVDEKLKNKLEENKPLSALLRADIKLNDMSKDEFQQYYELISKGEGIQAQVTPSPENLQQEESLDVASLIEQENISKQNLAKLENIYSKLLRNPSDLGGLASIADNQYKFVKIAKDPKDEVFEYWDELLPGYGDIMEDPEEHLDETVQEVEEKEKKKDPSHNK